MTARPLRRAAAIVAVALVLVTGACGKEGDDSDEVVRAIDRTTPLEHRFVYTVEGRSVGEIAVQGVVEDDFRYKLQLSLNGSPAIEQITSDDAVAVRFLDAGLVDGFTDKAVLDKVDQKTNVAGATVLDALRAQRWVLDEAGAPSAVVNVRDDPRGNRAAQDQDRDPLFEARTSLAYVRRAAQGGDFVRYDPESLEPTYRPDEDPFPKPSERSGVIRYDLKIADLPAASSATSGAAPILPSIANFRKMAVYVKDERVIAVREFIGVTDRQLGDLEDYVEAIIDATAPEDVAAGFRQQVSAKRGSPDELSGFLIDGLNTFVLSAGLQPIRFRTMSLEVEDFGAVEDRVTLPDDDAIRGDLALLQNLGRKPVTGAEDQGARPAVPQQTTATETADTTDTTPTTVGG